MAADSQSQLRLLAPVALFLFGIVFLVVVVASLDDPATSERERPAREARTQSDRPREASTGGRTSERNGSERVYVVKSGDTLASIAEETDVPIDKLLSLNPSVDPQGLVTGQRIKLRE